MRLFTKKRFCLILSVLLLFCVACKPTAKEVTDTASPMETEPSQSGSSATESAETVVFSFEVADEPAVAVSTLAPEPTPEPTPVPDSPFGTWSDDSGQVSVTVGVVEASSTSRENGTFSFNFEGENISVPCEVRDSSLVFTQNAGTALTVSYTVEGDCLTLSQPGQTDLVLNRAESTAAYGPISAETAGQTATDPFYFVWVDRATVTVEVSEGFTVSAYCFTSVNKQPSADSPDWGTVGDSIFSVYKSDGTFYLWLKDEAGTIYGPREVTVASGFTYPIKAEGLKSLSTSLESYATEHGTSADEITSGIYSDIGRAGLYTRQGAVTSGISLISRMAAMGASVTYQGHGSYQGEDDWGVNPQWGAKLKNPTTDGNGTYYYTGMQCVAAIVWAYKQAGLNLSNDAGSAIGTLGEMVKKGDNKIKYDSARSGDIVKQNGHYLMIVDRLDTNGDGADDTYLTYEMNAPHLTCLKLTFKQVRYREFFSMEGVFTNEGHRKNKARFWEDTFYIPSDSLPEELRSASESGNIARAAARLKAILKGTL